ncbi:hypothetical protein ALP29_201537 [Pseudomonas syringae pv. avii]|uniref:Uncharacterized protein n=1 Tax=Pseudomonas syringae pv. avii TaxID=663959 RepID=A0A3M5ULN9_PSESX|nr:hypothetical protein ALP29_201537 [Pseudomonas syringae pv. avii]
MDLLKVDQSAVADMAFAVQETPLRIQNRRLSGTGVQTGDRQYDLNVRREIGNRRCHHDSLAVQFPGQLAQEQLVDIRRQVARPAPVRRCGQGAIRLAL